MAHSFRTSGPTQQKAALVGISIAVMNTIPKQHLAERELISAYNYQVTLRHQGKPGQDTLGGHKSKEHCTDFGKGSSLFVAWQEHSQDSEIM